MNKAAGIIGVETVRESEDGSADYTFHMDAHTRGLLAEEGLRLVIHCAAAQMDIQEVYDFIEKNMGLTEYKQGEDNEICSND